MRWRRCSSGAQAAGLGWERWLGWEHTQSSGRDFPYDPSQLFVSVRPDQSWVTWDHSLTQPKIMHYYAGRIVYPTHSELRAMRSAQTLEPSCSACSQSQNVSFLSLNFSLHAFTSKGIVKCNLLNGRKWMCGSDDSERRQWRLRGAVTSSLNLIRAWCSDGAMSCSKVQNYY